MDTFLFLFRVAECWIDDGTLQHFPGNQSTDEGYMSVIM